MNHETKILSSGEVMKNTPEVHPYLHHTNCFHVLEDVCFGDSFPTRGKAALDGNLLHP